MNLRVRIALPLALFLPLLTGCNDEAKPAAAKESAAPRPSTAAAAARTYTEQDLRKRLLPVEQLPGYAKITKPPTSSANVDVADLMPLKGTPQKCQASAGTGLVDVSDLGPAAKTAPASAVGYAHDSTFFTEQLTALPAGTPPGAPKLRIPPGCERQDGKIQGLRSYAVLKQLGPGELPSIKDAEVSGLQVDFREKVADSIMMSYRLTQVRSGPLLMQVITAKNGDVAAATTGPVTKAWAHASRA